MSLKNIFKNDYEFDLRGWDLIFKLKLWMPIIIQQFKQELLK